MSEFHRMVTYLYLYEGNVKTRNVGYTKIAKQDAQCRVEIHMKNTGLNDDAFPVYFYTQNRTGFPGIFLGSLHFTRGTGELTKVLDASGFSDIKGLYLPISEDKMILSQWDDDTFDRHAFLPDDSSHIKAAEALPNPVPEESEEPEKSEESEFSQTFSSRWEFLMKNFPSVAPFPAEDSYEWVQLELRDLRLLPAPYRALGNNSFLVHGFFNYHHLLLGKKRDAEAPQWVLGIPGVFQNPERVMAAFFGFPEFISTAETAIKTGHFGYWIRSLE